MPFLLMVFLTLACLPDLDIWPQPLLPAPFHLDLRAWSALITGLTMLAPLIQAWFVSRRVVVQLKADVHTRDEVLHRYERARFFHQILQFGCFAVAMGVGGWGWTVNSAWRSEPVGLLPLAEIVVLLPLLVPMALSWAIFYDAENALHQAAHRLVEDAHESARRETPGSADASFFGGRWSYVLFQGRQKLALVCVPIGLLLGQKELQQYIGDISGEWAVLLNIAGFAFVLLVFLTMPLVVRLVLGLRTMPAGPLRSNLEETARRLRFRCSDILVWNTRKGMANAMVIGIFPWPRYVVFTDRLLHEFTPEEIEAVFGHEIGHVKHFHMLYYFLFLSVSMTVLGLLAHLCLSMFLSANQQHFEALPMVALVLLYIFVVFGFISRRCERQADIYGCRTVSCGQSKCEEHDAGVMLAPCASGLCPTGIRTFIRALEKVADVNGISRDRPGLLQSWQHSTIARRVAFLQQMITDPGIEPVFQRRVALVKWGLFVVLGVLLAAVLVTGSFALAG
jgi:Zn-dependent protease with chaperone function